MHRTLLLMTCNTICWVQSQRKVAAKNDGTIQVVHNIDRAIADIGIINIVENPLRKNVSNFLDMKT